MAAAVKRKATRTRTVYVAPKRLSWEKKILRGGAIAAAIASMVATFYYTTVYFIPWAVDWYNNDPFPLEGKKQHADELGAEIRARQESDRLHDAAQMEITTQLAKTTMTLEGVATKQQQDYKDGLAQQLERAQLAVNTAKAIYEKDPSENNKNILITLQSRIDELTQQVKDNMGK